MEPFYFHTASSLYTSDTQSVVTLLLFGQKPSIIKSLVLIVHVFHHAVSHPCKPQQKPAIRTKLLFAGNGTTGASDPIGFDKTT